MPAFKVPELRTGEQLEKVIIPLSEGAPGTEPGKMNAIIFNRELERGKGGWRVARNWLKASPSLDSILDLPATGKKNVLERQWSLWVNEHWILFIESVQ